MFGKTSETVEWFYFVLTIICFGGPIKGYGDYDDFLWNNPVEKCKIPHDLLPNESSEPAETMPNATAISFVF
jgi:hypothetical protein